MTTRPQSKFTHLTEAEFAAGLARLAADAKAEAELSVSPRPVPPRPVSERYDVAVFRLS
jgi:hypothetical protein